MKKLVRRLINRFRRGHLRVRVTSELAEHIRTFNESRRYYAAEL
jgi:hypothetical protein